MEKFLPIVSEYYILIFQVLRIKRPVDTLVNVAVVVRQAQYSVKIELREGG